VLFEENSNNNMLLVENWKLFIGLAYQGKHIMFRFIIEYSSLVRDFFKYAFLFLKIINKINVHI